MARILVIDDDESVRRVVGRSLAAEGHQITEAPDGKVGLRLYRENPPDLVITDIFMPEKEGLETIREIRRASPSAKILAITGADPGGSMDFLAHAAMMGAERTLNKPFTHDELVKAVREMLSVPPLPELP